jgi:transcriptional regulator with XRE-family HTH domain
MELGNIAWTRQACRTGAARAIRRAAGLSLAEIARAVGSTPSAVSRWERGLRVPRAEAAQRYGALLRELAGGTA